MQVSRVEGGMSSGFRVLNKRKDLKVWAWVQVYVNSVKNDNTFWYLRRTVLKTKDGVQNCQRSITI